MFGNVHIDLPLEPLNEFAMVIAVLPDDAKITSVGSYSDKDGMYATVRFKDKERAAERWRRFYAHEEWDATWLAIEEADDRRLGF